MQLSINKIVNWHMETKLAVYFQNSFHKKMKCCNCINKISFCGLFLCIHKHSYVNSQNDCRGFELGRVVLTLQYPSLSILLELFGITFNAQIFCLSMPSTQRKSFFIAFLKGPNSAIIMRFECIDYLIIVTTSLVSQLFCFPLLQT